MTEPREYRGTCAVCGAPVVVVAEFLSADWFTCNMETPNAHTADELRAVWEGSR